MRPRRYVVGKNIRRGWRIRVSFIAIESERRNVVSDVRRRAPHMSSPRRYPVEAGAAFDLTINDGFSEEDEDDYSTVSHARARRGARARLVGRHGDDHDPGQ